MGAASDSPVPQWIAAAAKVRFADLPAPHQKAIAQYMALDGEAWPSRWDPSYGMRDQFDAARFWADHLSFYTERYADRRFAVCDIPMAELTGAIMTCNRDVAEMAATWDEYHAWYRQGQTIDQAQGRGVPAGSQEIWPVILDSHLAGGALRCDDILQDGWHRLAHYYAAGVQVVPAVGFLPDERYVEQPDR